MNFIPGVHKGNNERHTQTMLSATKIRGLFVLLGWSNLFMDVHCFGSFGITVLHIDIINNILGKIASWQTLTCEQLGAADDINFLIL